jgi:hypothetical protein
MTTPPTPSIYTTAHAHASQHRAEVLASARCACFFCFRTFSTGEIKSWVDANQTALCPHCGIDSVLGDVSGQIGDSFLRRMHQQYFAYRSK